MFGVVQAIESLSNNIADSGTDSQLAPSPVRRGNAAKQVFQDIDKDTMSDEESAQFLKMLRTHTDIADMYMSINSKSRRVNYIRSELEDFIRK